jgi:hypothetical protein
MAVFLAAHIGAISGSIGTTAGMPFKKNWAKSTIKWVDLDFWGAVWEGRSHPLLSPLNGLKIASPLTPKWPQNRLRQSPFGGGMCVWGLGGGGRRVEML